MTTELVAHGAVLPLTKTAYTAFDQGRIDLIMNSKGKGAPLETFYAFLELSARYDLDPMANEIWLARMPGRNGGPGTYAVLVGRDGYLKVARRDPGFIDVDADVVYSKDEFRVTRKADGSRTVEHSYGNPAQRGEAVGAYAVLMRDGKPDRYFYAPLDQYAKRADKSAWSYRDSMIIKCAVSYITRLTYGVSGPVPADELGAGLALDQGHGTITVAGEDVGAAAPALPAELAGLVARAASVDPKSWRANEIAARLPEPDDRAYDAAVRQITSELVAWLAENEPQDAVVVPDAADVPEPGAECQHRWDTDPAWREKAQPVLARYADAEAALEEAIASGEGGEAETAARNLVEAVGAELYALGVPAGWYPDSPVERS